MKNAIRDFDFIRDSARTRNSFTCTRLLLLLSPTMVFWINLLFNSEEPGWRDCFISSSFERLGRVLGDPMKRWCRALVGLGEESFISTVAGEFRLTQILPVPPLLCVFINPWWQIYTEPRLFTHVLSPRSTFKSLDKLTKNRVFCNNTLFEKNSFIQSFSKFWSRNLSIKIPFETEIFNQNSGYHQKELIGTWYSNAAWISYSLYVKRTPERI